MTTDKPKKNILVRSWHLFWNTIGWLRVALLNIVFLVVLAVVVATMIESSPKPISQPGPLFIAPSGTLVDQLSYQPPLAALAGDTPPETHLRSLIQMIEHASGDDRVTGLIIKLNDLTGGGMSKMQELGEAIERFKATDKPVIAYGNFLAQQQYYLASYADTIFIHDMGGVAITGFGLYRNYFKGLIDKLGINVNVFKSGTFKDFVEPYTREDMSEPSREHNEAWLTSLWSTFSTDIESRRGLLPGQLDNYVKQLPQLLSDANGDSAELAKNYQLVDRVGSKQALLDYLIAQFGPSADDDAMFNYINPASYQRELAVAQFNQQGNIGLIVAAGSIMDGEQPEGSIGGDSLSYLIRGARNDDNLKALVIRVDSGGGSAFASELIRQEITETRAAGKPVFISMGSVAASGGYWMSTGADQIWATPTTLTGSIGVFSIVPTFESTLDKIGVTSDGIATSELAGLFQLERPMTEQAKTVFQMGVESVYSKFLTVTAEARGQSIGDIKKVAEGRVWLGQQALEHGLVDNLGSLEDTIAALADFANIETPVVTLVERELTTLEQIVKNLSLNSQATLDTLLPSQASDRLLNNLTQHANQSPLIQMLAQQSQTPNQPRVFALCPECTRQ
ncbi:MAG TPA: signal peptide peptidase SppA [Marinagarivorans sp.]